MNRGEFGLALLDIEGYSIKKYTDAERERLIPQLAESEPWQTKCTIAMEECAELIQEISKMIQKGEKGLIYGHRISLGYLKKWQTYIYACGTYDAYSTSAMLLWRTR
jgi:hypothetical protein